ncbi:hypothetical protein MANES_14G084950v8 [Manihot esculenta]|uniref:Uncharacterized protein n=1 Tax=Manihot esculenta TaxID=3983 RepID=A0ACB7GGQ3_MANES|nr:hypothetical protein MANES_14G084950v8 [Manihot esculenta]
MRGQKSSLKQYMPRLLVNIHATSLSKRPIRRWLEKKVVTELSRMLLKVETDENSTVYIDARPKGNELVYQVENNGGLVNATAGQKAEVLIQIPSIPRNDAAQAVKKMMRRLE